MRRESGVEDDGVLFISPSVSTLPFGVRGSDGNCFDKLPVAKRPRVLRDRTRQRRGRTPMEKMAINNRRSRVSKKPIDTLILPGGGHQHDAKLREIVDAYNLADNKSISSHLSLLVQDTTYIIPISSPVRDDVSGVDQ
jgi:hypothetical protein